MRITSPADIRWLPIILLSLSVAFSLFGDMAMYAIVPTYHTELGLTPLQVGLVLSLNRWIRLFTNPLAGRLLKPKNQTAFLAAALIVGSALSALYAASPPFVVLLFARVVWGACWSFIRHSGIMASLALGPEKRSGRIIGTYQGLVQVGFIAGTFSGGFLFDLVGFQKTFIIMCVISVISIPLELVGIRRHQVIESKVSVREERPTSERVGVPLILKGFIVACVGSGLVMSTLGYVLKSELGNTVRIGTSIIGISTLNGFLLAVRNIIASAGALLAGVAIDRTRKGLVERISFTSAALILAAAILLMDSAIVIPLVVVFFAASTVSRVALFSRAGVRGPKAFAKFVTASDLGAATGPLLGWIGIDAVSDPRTIFIAGCILYMAAMFLPVRSR